MLTLLIANYVASTLLGEWLGGKLSTCLKV